MRHTTENLKNHVFFPGHILSDCTLCALICSTRDDAEHDGAGMRTVTPQDSWIWLYALLAIVIPTSLVIPHL
jgi:hypothetical protein